MAYRKALGLKEVGAEVVVIAPEFYKSASGGLAEEGVTLLRQKYSGECLAGAFLVIAATDDVTVQEAVHREAEAHNLLVNVADVPKWCNFILPATVRRGDLTISVSTAGKSPALAKQLRKNLEKEYTDDYDLLLQVLGRLRPIVLALGLPHEKNKILFENLLHRDMIDWLRRQDWQALTDHIRSILGKDIPLDDLVGHAEQ